MGTIFCMKTTIALVTEKNVVGSDVMSYRVMRKKEKEKQRRRRKAVRVRADQGSDTFHILKMAFTKRFCKGVRYKQRTNLMIRSHCYCTPACPSSGSAPVFQYQGRIYLKGTATVGR